jgi:polysaccharide export outer membrane protein
MNGRVQCIMTTGAERFGLSTVNNLLKRLSFAICLVSFAFYITACASSARESAKNRKATVSAKDRQRNPIRSSIPISQTAANPRSSMSSADPLPTYRLSFGDVLEIRFFGNPEFNVTNTIRPDGRMTMEKIGELFIVGMTPEELDNLITAKYSRFIKEPDVTVIVRSFGKRNVFLLGHVNGPGAYEIEPGMTVLRVLTRAGGYQVGAKLNSIILMRAEYFQAPKAYRIDLENFPAKADLASDPLVEPNDIIYVPRTFVSDATLFMNRFFALVNAPLDFLLRAYFLFERNQ